MFVQDVFLILSIYVQKPVKIDWKCQSTSSPWKGPPKWPVWQAFESLTSKNVKISSTSLQNIKIIPKMWNLGLFLATEKHGKNPRSHYTEVWDCSASSINAEGLKNDFWKKFHDTVLPVASVAIKPSIQVFRMPKSDKRQQSYDQIGKSILA